MQTLEKKKPSPRVLSRDGRFNIVAERAKGESFKDLYHQLLSISWPKFFLLILAGYLLTNLFFACGYFLCGPSALAGIRRGTAGQHFLDCFFFSVQTIATIGYGRISPLGLYPNILVTIEALMGLLILGLVSGLFFSRFSKPTARVAFSNRALISPDNGRTCFIFRMANERLNQIVEAHVSVSLVKTEVNEEGDTYRRIYELPLERSHSPIFVMTWTVVHPVAESSPLYGMTRETLEACEAEIVVSMTGMDNVFHQTIHARFSYTAEDLVWNGRYAEMLTRTNGKTHVALSKLHEIIEP